MYTHSRPDLITDEEHAKAKRRLKENVDAMKRYFGIGNLRERFIPKYLFVYGFLASLHDGTMGIDTIENKLMMYEMYFIFENLLVFMLIEKCIQQGNTDFHESKMEIYEEVRDNLETYNEVLSRKTGVSMEYQEVLDKMEQQFDTFMQQHSTSH